MTADLLASPSDFAPPPTRSAGGDSDVPRDDKTRPRIIVDCWLCDGTGKRPSEKTGKPVNCTGCRPYALGEFKLDLGKRLKSYTRTTTYIDVIEDKTNLGQWDMRMVLVGLARNRGLLDGVEDACDTFLKLERKGLSDTDEAKEIKDDLNRRAQIAKQKAGAEDKADKGTHLHALSELVDLKQDLPKGISFGDVIDMDAYRKVTSFLRIIHMERLVVHDGLCIGGTPDRVSELEVEVFKVLFREMWEEHGGLVAPDGAIILPGDRLITDLKTGSVEYGGLKMAMQLGIYSQSKLYDPKTGERSDLEGIRQDWGIIMHVPASTGTATLYWADLTLGWKAVQVATEIRELRRMSRKALTAMRSEGRTVAAA